jgi:hypothetical protein
VVVRLAGITGAEDDGVAKFDEAASGLTTQALVRSGNKGDCHASMLTPLASHAQVPFDGRTGSTTLDAGVARLQRR